jgi:hypothetical protein
MTSVLTDSYGQSLFDTGGAPLTVEISGDLWSLPPGPNTALSFFCMELDVYQPATGTAQPYAYGRMAHPRMAATLYPQASDSSASLYASDMGYRSRATDTIGVRPYPAVMDQSFEIDRHVGLAPGQASTTAFGTLRLSNLGKRYDTFVQGKNSDSRAVRLFLGNKVYDQTRGVYMDPSYANLTAFFIGTAGSWTISEDELEIPLKDSTYWADRPIQGNFYLGTGGYNGGSDLTGRPIPMVRGGTSSAPVQNAPLTTLDSVNLIYQYTDTPGTVVTLYEGDAAVFTYDGDVSDLYAGTPPAPGHYRTCNVRGMVQMGSVPVRALTADCTGTFLISGAVSTAVNIAKWVLLETLGQPSAMVDTTSFGLVDAAYPYTAGFFAGSGESGLDIVQFLLGSIGARLITSRSGKLTCLPLRKVTAAAASSAPKLATTNCTSIVPAALQPPLDTPPFRWRVGYNRIYAVHTSDFDGAVTANRKVQVGTDYQFATWSSADVTTAWNRPSDPDPVGTALLVQSDAQALANALGALWGEHPGLWTVEMPITAAVGLDMGSIVQVTWPLVELAGTRPGQIVGEQVRSFDSTVQFTVLVGAG